MPRSVLVVLALATPAQGAPPQVTLVLCDGSLVKGVTPPEAVEIVTRQGTVSVPFQNVRRIEFGFRLSEKDAREVEEAVARLGSRRFRERERAGTRLLALGRKAYPAVLRASRSKDSEVARRAADVVEQLQREIPADWLQTTQEDTLTTASGVLVGRLREVAFEAQSSSLGRLTVRLADLRSLHSAADGSHLSAERVRVERLRKVVRQVRGGTKEDDLVNEIRKWGVAYRLTAGQLLWLRQNAVSEVIIGEVQGVRRPDPYPYHFNSGINF